MLHISINTQDFQDFKEDFQVFHESFFLEIVTNFDDVTIKKYSVDDDWKPSLWEEKRIGADVSSHGSCVLSPTACAMIFQASSEKIEIFRDLGKVWIFAEGFGRFEFPDDYLEEVESKRLEKEAQEEADRKAWEDEQDAKYWRSYKPETRTSIYINPQGIYKSVGHCLQKDASATIENGTLIVQGDYCVAVRETGSQGISTNNIIHWIKSFKNQTGIIEFSQEADGSAYVGGEKRYDLTRPEWLQWDRKRRVAPLFYPDLCVTKDADFFGKVLRRHKAKDKIILMSSGESFVIFAGTLKKSLAAFTNPVFFVGKCEKGRYYIVVTSKGSQDFDIIPALPCKPDPDTMSLIGFRFQVNDMKAQEQQPEPKPEPEPEPEKEPEKQPEKQPAQNGVSALVLSSSDFSGGSFSDTVKRVGEFVKKASEPETKPETEQEQEKEKRVKIAPLESSAPLASVPEPEPEPEPEPMEEKPEPEPDRSGAGKSWVVGTYTTKKGKIKAAITFTEPPTAEIVETLKSAWYWEFNGRWIGSPRKLPEIFK